MKAKLLVVDDEDNVRSSLGGVLEDEGYSVDAVGSGEECLHQVEQRSYDVIFLDVWLPGMDGLAVLKELKTLAPTAFVIMISGHGSIETAVQATKLGAFDFVEKPLSLDKIMLVLEHALNQQLLETENESLKEFVRRETVMIGTSVPMQALRQQIVYAAPTEGRVLIYGENGTGKELVARLLHLQSPRSKRQFVEVNCAAIPDDLIESELFGSVKGAYTGSTESRKGKFELAHQGTLFLDEVGDMSLKTQAKVLRVLEEQRFHPVGSNSSIDVDVRVIAATNKNLEQHIEAGTFREDLFFRLNVIPFEVPPLRQKPEDVPLLLDHFMELFSRRYGKSEKTFSEEALHRLKAYHWPGNVRELKNTVERLVIMLQKEEVCEFDLPLSIIKASANGQNAGGSNSWLRAREEFERDFILKSLAANEGNISRTAAAIGMERSYLHRKLKAYNIK
ncbi:MAG: sigma-54-dependent Fis family transcriptional regulator [Acidobacteriota bacterium]|nr:MAG: sigma-54-dependent Fis family transcriptional regulator [Acidobacteriota bacterium]